MTTISLNSPKTPKEIRNLAWAQGVIKSVESSATKVVEKDGTSDDFVPGQGSVAVADLALGKRAYLSGSVDYNPESKEIQSANLEKSLPVEVEVDHMMWGTFHGTSSMQMTRSGEQTTYTVKDEVKDKITRDYTIVVDQQNQTLSFDFEQHKGPWVGRTRGF